MEHSNFKARRISAPSELLPGEACYAYSFAERSSQAASHDWLSEQVLRLVRLNVIPHRSGEGERNQFARAWAKGWWGPLLGEDCDEPLLGVEASRTTIEADGLLYRSVLEFVPAERRCATFTGKDHPKATAIAAAAGRVPGRFPSPAESRLCTRSWAAASATSIWPNASRVNSARFIRT